MPNSVGSISVILNSFLSVIFNSIMSLLTSKGKPKISKPGPTLETDAGEITFILRFFIIIIIKLICE